MPLNFQILDLGYHIRNVQHNIFLVSDTAVFTASISAWFVRGTILSESPQSILLVTQNSIF
jgi:hypothetical protein